MKHGRRPSAVKSQAVPTASLLGVDGVAARKLEVADRSKMKTGENERIFAKPHGAAN